jgi:hypothetical protein
VGGWGEANAGAVSMSTAKIVTITLRIPRNTSLHRAAAAGRVGMVFEGNALSVYSIFKQAQFAARAVLGSKGSDQTGDEVSIPEGCRKGSRCAKGCLSRPLRGSGDAFPQRPDLRVRSPDRVPRPPGCDSDKSQGAVN